MNDPVEAAKIAERTGYLIREFGTLRGFYTFNKVWLVVNRLTANIAEALDVAFYLLILVGVFYGVYKLVKRLI